MKYVSEDSDAATHPFFLIMGNFNGHNPLWGSKDLNSHGKLVEDFINNNCLCILNNGEYINFHEPSEKKYRHL